MPMYHSDLATRTREHRLLDFFLKQLKNQKVGKIWAMENKLFMTARGGKKEGGGVGGQEIDQ